MSRVDPSRYVPPASRVREFAAVTDGTYRMRCIAESVEYSITRLRWDRHELMGMLTVTTTLPGARTIDGRLSMGTFCVTSTTARYGRAKDLETSARAPELDFSHQLEEFCQRVMMAEERGRPVIQLSTLEPRPHPEDSRLNVLGFPILKHHPTILFGDGGTGKSTLALYMAGELERKGVSVLFLDWELDEYDHRDQLRKLFGPQPPDVKYRRCERPLSIEAEGIAQQVAECGIEFVIADSVAFACVGAPEAAEAAQGYFRALRSLKCGSLNLAHITKSEGGDKKPFGSSFWFNGARSVWYVERSEGMPGDVRINLGLYQRKFNLGPARPAIGMSLNYHQDSIQVVGSNVADDQQLASKMSMGQRMKAALSKGPKTTTELADELESTADHIRRTLNRNKTFLRLVDGRIALAQRAEDTNRVEF